MLLENESWADSIEVPLPSQINNPGWKAFPVNVSLHFPTKLEHNFEMKNYHVFVEQVGTPLPQ